MHPLAALLVFGIDAGLVLWLAWLLAWSAGVSRRGLLEASLAWLLLGLAWVTASGVLLGLVGALGSPGFFATHLAVLVVWFVARRRDWSAAATELRALAARWREEATRGPDRVFVVGLALLFAGLLILACGAEPVVFDALTYRLSRVAAWLQDGHIRMFASDDPRLNYMPVAPDVVVAWLLGATAAGFHGAGVAQTLGGLLLLGATFGLARMVGLTRRGAWGAVVLLLGMAHVAVQLTTIQSDLFTAGVFAAAYYLWHRAMLRGEGCWLAGVGVALAFGSKGTMFYFAPGALCWVAWLAWKQRVHWRALLPTAAGLLIGALVFILPGVWRNQHTYGAAFGPRDAVVLHHGPPFAVAGHLEKLARNLETSAVQALEPTAQPFWLQSVSHALGERALALLPADADPYVFIGQSRRDQVERVMKLTEPDADVVTTGLLAVAVFGAGALAAALRRDRAGSAQVLVWAVGVVVYLLTQHALVQWHHWAFRFTVLAAPWVAVVGAWGVMQLGARGRLVVWTILGISALDVFANVQLRANQAGWQAWTRPERAFSHYTYSHWRNWAESLDEPARPLRVAFPIDRPLTAFFRLPAPRDVEITQLSALAAPTAEAAVDDGWLAVPLETFMGREGRVMGSANPAFGLAAYRALRPGELPRPLIYRQQVSDVGEIRRCEWTVRRWTDMPFRLEISNPGVAACAIELRTSLGTVRENLPAGGRRVFEVAVPPDELAPVTLDFNPPPDVAGTRTNLRIRLAP